MFKSIKKGFTLIELLATIIILAIIALLATPIVLDVIEESRDSANKSTAYGIIDAGRLYYADSVFDDEKRSNIGNNTDIYDLMIVNGKKPDVGQLFVDNDGNVAISVTIDNKCYVKNYTGDMQIYPKDDENCDLEFFVTGGNVVVEVPTPICKRAEILHTEQCNGNCSSAGYTTNNKGKTIEYGSLGTKGVLTSGDAFDCDVNGNGNYGECTTDENGKTICKERFYYVTDLEGDSTTGVLIYYNNIIQDTPNNTSSAYIAYYNEYKNYLGPLKAINNLPTTEQWSNVQLSNPIRAIKTELGESSVYSGQYKLPTDFNYGGHAARLLTAEEVNTACGIAIGNYSSGELFNCEYLLENTSFSSYGLSSGYWLESPKGSYYSDIWYAYGSGYVSSSSAYSSSYAGVRPVIEVPKSRIDYGNNASVVFTVKEEVFNEDGWAKEDFYVKINVVDNSGFGIKEFKVCTTTEGVCDPVNGSVVTGSTKADRYITTNGSNRVCVQVTDNSDFTGDTVCSSIYKLDNTKPNVTLKNDIVNNVNNLIATLDPTESVSGYNYVWYKDGNILSDINSLTYVTANSGTYKIVVTTNAGGIGESNEIVVDRTTVGQAALCVRATSLHTTTCDTSSSYYYCSQKYNSGAEIEYGSLGTQGVLTGGDAFDCDVNGDGVYNPETERFYYVTDLDNNAEYGVLIYSGNTNQGVMDNTTSGMIAYSDYYNYYGPNIAITNLPTVDQWKNVRLTNEIRAIKNHLGGDKTDGSYNLPTDFSYEGYAARLLTYNEILRACNLETPSYVTDTSLKNCEYFMENTKYSSDSFGTQGYWLESPYASNYYSGLVVRSEYNYVDTYSADTNYYFGVRPVIEVLKDNMNYGNTLLVEYSVEDDVFNEQGWANEDFYVNIKVTDISGYGIKDFKVCTTLGETCDPEDGSFIEGTTNSYRLITTSGNNKVCVQVSDNSGFEPPLKCSPIYKLDKTVPSVTLTNTESNGTFTLKPTIDPEEPISGYKYEWYRNNQLVSGLVGNYMTSVAGTYKLKVVTNAGLAGESNEIIVGNSTSPTNSICRRATTLHDAVMTYEVYDEDTYEYIIKTENVVLGNLGNNSSLALGDAFDCDVNGDGIYDSANERFYYLKDLDANSNYAVMLYYSNTTKGIPDDTNNNITIYNETTYEDGPVVAVKNLPTTSQWKNIRLYNNIRTIRTYDSEGPGDFVSNFDYSGYAARFLSYKEFEICKDGYYISVDCGFALERTSSYEGSEIAGYWTDTVGPYSSIYVIGDDGYTNPTSDGYSYDEVRGYGARPVIEVLKGDIDLNAINQDILVEYKAEDGAINEKGWAKEEFYVSINVIDNKGFGIKSFDICTTDEDYCDPSSDSTIQGSTGTRLIATQGYNKICVRAIDNNNSSSDVICSDVYKLDKTVPTVSLTKSFDNDYPVLTGTVNPDTTISGYNYLWYKNGVHVPGFDEKTFIGAQEGTYKLKVVTNAGIEAISNEINIGDSTIVCKRATKLHTDICKHDDKYYYCSGGGFTEEYKGTDIEYGSLGTNGVLASGDAFDCDVNGDGYFDSETERFYYISDLYNTTTKEFDSNYAVLTYYSNTTKGVPDNTEKSAFMYGITYLGPRFGIRNLPTTKQWKNVYLSNTKRAIVNAEGGLEYEYDNNYSLPTAFSYDGYAARFLTLQEIVEGCNIEVGYVSGYLDGCNYLLENTDYANPSIGSKSYWLETVKTNEAWKVNGKNRSAHYDGINVGVRPVIEVPKSNIDTTKVDLPVNDITVTFTTPDGTFNDKNWAKDEFYVDINIQDVLGYGINKFNVCTTSNESCLPSLGSTMTGNTGDRLISKNGDNKICVQAIYNNSKETSKIVCSDTYKVDTTKPIINISKYSLNTNILLSNIEPEDSVSGYVYSWYKDNVLIPNSNKLSYAITESGTYKMKVSTISGNESYSNEIVVSDHQEQKVLCKRATELHTEICEQNDNYYYCSGNGISNGATITYGNLGKDGALLVGDAFDCDVNGNGNYGECTTDANGKTICTERFYYVSDLFDVQSETFNDDYAVLVYYNNTYQGNPNNSSDGMIEYNIVDYDAEYGPKTAMSNLPTIEQWKNTRLYSTTRYSSSDYYHSKNVINYDGYAARMLTYIELDHLCDFDSDSSNLGICNFLYENTMYSSYNIESDGYWLESNSSNYYGYFLSAEYYSLSTAYYDYQKSVRPAIEVHKSNMDINLTKQDNELNAEFTAEDGVINENGWANKDFYVDITLTDKIGYGIKEFAVCSTASISCDPIYYTYSGSTGSRLVTVNGDNRICVKAITMDGSTTDVVCSDVFKLDKVVPIVTVTSDSNNVDGLTSIVNPVTNDSGYSYQWYKDDAVIENTNNSSLVTSGDGVYMLKVTTGSGLVGTSNKFTVGQEVSTVPLCRRASVLHTEQCEYINGTCSELGYYETGSKGTRTITYGNLGVEGQLISGDAFDCDINGDGEYDAATERFYYVTDLDTNPDYAVLIYYNNTKNGVATNAVDSNLSYSSYNYYGPTNARTYLPSTSQWTNVTLYRSYRPIKTEFGGTTINNKTLPVAFSYSGYAARLLTTQEISAACDIEISTSQSVSDKVMDGCIYFLEGTQFASGNKSAGYWLETPHAHYYNSYAWRVYASFRKIDYYTSHYGDYGTRPVIEVNKANIDFKVSSSSNYVASIRDYSCPEGGTLNGTECILTENSTCPDGYEAILSTAEPIYSSTPEYACYKIKSKVCPTGYILYNSECVEQSVQSCNGDQSCVDSKQKSDKVCPDGYPYENGGSNCWIWEDVGCSEEYEAFGDRSQCKKKYSAIPNYYCPQGGTLNGIMCVK